MNNIETNYTENLVVNCYDLVYDKVLEVDIIGAVYDEVNELVSLRLSQTGLIEVPFDSSIPYESTVYI